MVPETLRTGSSSDPRAMRSSFSSQSVSRARSGPGKTKGRAQGGRVRAAMPLRSPLKMPGACSVSVVLPPSIRLRPPNIRLPGRAPRCQAARSKAARVLDRRIASLTGTYLEVPLVVPEDRAKYGMRPGQDTSCSTGKAGCQ